MVTADLSGQAKSTLIRSLNHLEEYKKGVVRFFDQPLSRIARVIKVIYTNRDVRVCVYRNCNAFLFAQITVLSI